MRLATALLALACLLAPAARAQITGQPVPEMAHYDSALQTFFQQRGITGAAVAVAQGGRLVYARGFGLADVEAGTPVAPDAQFRLASISKPITAVAVMKLVEDGLLSLDAPAFALLPDLPAPPGQTEDPRLAQITVRDLLQHSGGWNRDGTGYDPMFDVVNIAHQMGVTPPADVETIVRYMRGRPLDFDPGTQYAYSNFGYAVLGRIVERVSGMAYEDYVLGLLAPTGVSRMALGGTRPEDRLPHEVRYYGPDSDPVGPSVFPPHATVPWPYGGFYLEAMDAHGGWVSSAPDLLRFVEAVDGRPGRPDVLSAQTLQTMTARPAVPTWNGTSYWYGLGWLVNTFNNWWHDGSLPGNRSYVLRLQFQTLSYCVLMNERLQPEGTFLGDLDNLLFTLAQQTGTWPTHDLFDLYTAAEPGAAGEAGVGLSAAAPNPFASATALTLTLDAPRDVRVEVLDALGRRVATLHDGPLAAGAHALRLDAGALPSGPYLVRALGDGVAATQRVTLAR